MSIAFSAAGGALWWHRDWIPNRGLFNPCHEPRLQVYLVLLAAVLVVVRDFYSHVFVAPFTKVQVFTGLALKDEPRPHEVFREWPESLPRRDGSTALARILDSGVVRVCYRGNDYPSAFKNSDGATQVS